MSSNLDSGGKRAPQIMDLSKSMDMLNICIETGEMAPLINMTFECPCKKLNIAGSDTYNPSPGDAETGGSQNLLVNHFSQIDKLQVHQESLLQNLKCRMIKETQCLASRCTCNIYIHML